MQTLRNLLVLASVGAATGCSMPRQSKIDDGILALGVYDGGMHAPSMVDPMPAADGENGAIVKSKEGHSQQSSSPALTRSAEEPPPTSAATKWSDVVLVSYDQDSSAPRGLKRLQIPAVLPGADAPAIQMPEDGAKRAQVIRELYPPIPPLPAEPLAAPGPERRPLSLSDLQRFGEKYSPNIKSAIAAVEAAKGAALQAGMYPNPTMGFEHDTVETGPAGYPGFFFDQIVKTGGKLKAQAASAVMDYINAQLALKRARSDLRYSVRGGYFAVLVAIENVRVSDALYRFTEEIYRVQVDLLDKGFAAAYEPMQLRPLVLQAKLNLIQARNQYRAAWRQLTAAVGLPEMPPSELEGSVDPPLPLYDYERLLAGLERHTDVQTAYYTLQKSHYQLRLAQAAPQTDLEFRVLVQKDYSASPNQIAHSAQLIGTVPIWDQNKGGIHAAKWGVSQSAVGVEQARNALAATLADAFNRYQTARLQVKASSEQIRDQVRAYRGLYERRQSVPDDVAFFDLVNARQTLGTYIQAYITALGFQWQAVADLANLQQDENLFQVGQPTEAPPIPPLSLLKPPCISAPTVKSAAKQSSRTP